MSTKKKGCLRRNPPLDRGRGSRLNHRREDSLYKRPLLGSEEIKGERKEGMGRVHISTQVGKVFMRRRYLLKSKREPHRGSASREQQAYLGVHVRQERKVKTVQRQTAQRKKVDTLYFLV